MKLYGKDKLIAYFKTALQRHTVSHLYVFEGAVGMGKKTLCHHIARLLLCEGDEKPCETCGACIKSRSGNHPDIIRVEIDEKNPMTVERARSIVAEMYVKPFLGERKIYIFPDAERLSPSVQNTLLKAFEEPPPFITIFLTVTARDALLKTVLSRSIILPLSGCSVHALCAFISENYPEREADAAFLAAAAGGSIGAAKSLAEDTGYLEMREALFSVLPRLTASRAGIYPILRCFETYKASLPSLLSLFSSWMRDVIYIQLSDEDALLNHDYASSISDFAFSVSPKAATGCHEAALSLAASIGKGSNFTLWITDFLSECWRYCHDTNCRC